MVPPLQRYYGTLRLPAVRLDPFDVFTSRYHRVARGLLPWVAGVLPGARELSVPVSHPDLRWKRRGLSGSLETLMVIVPVLFDPGRIRQAEWTMSELPDTAPAYVQNEGS